MAKNFVQTGLDSYNVMDADILSDPINAGAYETVSIQADIETTDADGYLYIQGSNNRQKWSTLNFRDENDAIVDGYHIQSDATTHIFDASGIGVGWLRAFYDRTSGTGGLTLYISRKK